MNSPSAPASPPHSDTASRRAAWRHAVELLSSMRFAISLLTFLAIASVIGTILKQNEPYNNYLNQFGQFWFAVFETLSLYAVYNAWWFMLILAFLVTSTSLCVFRNAPKMIAQMRTFKEQMREQSFAAFAHHAEFRVVPAAAVTADAVTNADAAADAGANASADAAGTASGSSGAAVALVARVDAGLKQAGFATKHASSAGGTMVAAKAGSANRLGYIFAHCGIVIICVGGLLDGDVLLRAQLLLGGKAVVKGNPLISEIPPQSRLAASNPSFRGNILIPEGGGRDFALLNHGEGLLLQELPFKLDLKRFVIEHYDTGAPKLFASDVVVTDKDTGKSFEKRIEVNHPLIHKGIAVYQSSFDDGGTRVKLKGYPMAGERDYSFTVDGEIGSSTALTPASAEGATDKSLTLEFTSFRVFNIERIGRSSEARVQSDESNAGGNAGSAARAAPGATPATAPQAAPPAAPSLADKLKQGLGPGTAPGREKEMRNVGPSVGYKLRDAAGQAREYHNYMLPMLLDGRQMLLAGMRENPNESFRYMRLPIDANGSLDEFMRLRAAVLDESLRAAASASLARQMLPKEASDAFRQQLTESARRALETFGAQGFTAVAAFLEKGVPEAEREKAADIFVRLLNGAAFEAWQMRRERDGLKRTAMDDVNGRFVQDGLNAISDSFFYGAPVYLHLNSFDEVKASVFQLTRSPGKNIVYTGSLLLVLGVFAMLYIRERRAWVLVKADGRVLFAMSALRRGVDDDREFARMRAHLGAQLGVPPDSGAAAGAGAALPGDASGTDVPAPDVPAAVASAEAASPVSPEKS